MLYYSDILESTLIKHPRNTVSTDNAVSQKDNVGAELPVVN